MFPFLLFLLVFCWAGTYVMIKIYLGPKGKLGWMNGKEMSSWVGMIVMLILMYMT